jgi:hypothetical protein
MLVGTIVAIGVGANATPALASDGVEPVAPPELSVSETIPGAPEINALETAIEAAAEEPPIVVDTNLEGGDIDVSVRILSPETDPDATANEAGNAISEAFESDITADPVLPDTPPAGAGPSDDDTLDTNIAIRILSPGRNGSVQQQSGDADEEPAAPKPKQPTPDDAQSATRGAESADGAQRASQYHADNTQYQSEGIAIADTWAWDWYLTLDCDGNVTTTSSELGTPSSRDWNWNWTWDWTCGMDGASEKSGDALQKGFDSIASVSSSGAQTSAASGGPPTASSGASAASGAQPDPSGSRTPWLWTWSFDFCGRATTFSIPAGEQTDLEWTWNWTWAWACTSAEVVSSAPGGEGASGPAADEGTPSGELVLPSPLAIMLEQPLLEIPFETPTMVGPAGFEAPMSIAPVIPLGRTFPTGTGPEHAPASGPGRAPVSAPTLTTIAPVAADITTASPGSSQPERVRATKTRDREAAPRPARRLPQLPLGPSRRAAGSSTSSSGAAPGGGAAGGVAALTGLYVLAAPGLGRRLRVVRELSPHARAEAPRDRPG